MNMRGKQGKALKEGTLIESLINLNRKKSCRACRILKI